MSNIGSYSGSVGSSNSSSSSTKIGDIGNISYDRTVGSTSRTSSTVASSGVAASITSIAEQISDYERQLDELNKQKAKIQEDLMDLDEFIESENIEEYDKKNEELEMINRQKAYVNDLKEKFVELDSFADYEHATPPKNEHEVFVAPTETLEPLPEVKIEEEPRRRGGLAGLFQSGLDWLKETGATIAVGTTSIISGVLDVGEALLDGGAYLVSGALNLVGLDDASTAVKEFIATDLVSEANKAFYENTEIGRAINDASSLKYDSEAAQGIRDVSEKITVFAAATAATVLTGGAAAPFVTAGLGFAYGVGEQAETTYQQGTDTTWKEETGILLNGVFEAVNWYAQGKMGKSGLDLAGAVNEYGFKQTGAALWNGAKSTFTNIRSNGFMNTARGMIRNSSLTKEVLRENLRDSVGIIADNGSDWLLGNEEFNAENVLAAGGELVFAWTLNTVFDGATNYVNDLQNISTTKSFITRFMADPSITIPGGMSPELLDYLGRYLKDPAAVPPDGVPQEIIDYIKTLQSPRMYQHGAIVPTATIDQIETRLSRLATATPEEYSRYSGQLRYMASSTHLPPDEVQRLMDEQMAIIYADSEIGRRTGVRTLERCLDSGRIMNQFETGISSGYNNHQVRANIELEAFNVPIDSAYADRPVYGMLFPSDPVRQADYVRQGPGTCYGQGRDKCVIIFNKDAVEGSTSLTLGDSLNHSNSYGGGVSATLASDPKYRGGYRGFGNRIYTQSDITGGTLESFTSGGMDTYIEAQIHGAQSHAMNSTNVKEVLFQSQPPQSLIDKLANLGIPWRII